MKKIFTKLIGVTLGLAMAVGVGVGVAANSRKATRLDADGTDLVFSFNYEDIPDGFTATTGTSGDFDVESNPNVLTVNYSGINTKSKASAADHAYGYAMFLKNYGYIYSGNEFSGYYVSNVKVVIGSNSGETGKIGCSFNSSAITTRNSSVNGSVTKGETYNFPNVTTTKTYWNFSTTGANVQIDSFVITYSVIPQEGSHYVVTFNSNGGSEVAEGHPADDNLTPVARPADPTRTGYTFEGWYRNPDFSGTTYDFSAAVTENFTLYAKWAKVSLTPTYSPSANFTNGTGYRIQGEVTAIISTSGFFVQDGDNVMLVYDSAACASVSVGNVVDVYGVYNSQFVEITSVAYCDKVSEDTVNSQTPITDLEDVTLANRYKYFEISGIQLNSPFSDRQASIKGSSVVVFYQYEDRVNGGAFVPGDYATNDYVSLKGIINKTNNDIPELQIVSIQKLLQYTITFESNGGSAVSSQSVLEGGTAEEPADPTKASDEEYDYAFVAWYDNEQLSGDPYDFDTPVTSTKTLYAKWNRTDRPAKDAIEALTTGSSLTYRYSKSGNGAVDVLNEENTYEISTDEGTSYKNWTNSALSSGVTYVGHTHHTNDSIQLKSKDSISGIVTTANTNNHKATVVSVVWESHTGDGKSIEIYGKNTSYSSAADLYDEDARGTSLGSITKGTSTSFAVVGDYKYIGIKSSDGAIYLTSVSIQWGSLATYTYSNVAIKFGGQVNKTLWNKLNTQSTIVGYGVMLGNPSDLGSDSLETWYEAFKVGNFENSFETTAGVSYLKETNIKNFYNPVSALPTDSGDNYVWNLVKGVNGTNAGLTRRYTAVAYILTADDDVVFLQETTKSAAQVAAELMAADPTVDDSLEGSMANLASKYVAA